MKKKIINIVCFCLALIPFFIFFKDFATYEGLSQIFTERSLIILKNSVYQALLSTFFALIVSIFPAIYIAKRKNRVATVIESTFFIPFFFPVIPTIISFSLIYSFAGTVVKENIMYTLTAVIIAHVFYDSPIFVKYIGDGLRKIPESVIEAAKIDGAGRKDIFFKIELPMIIPAIMKGFFLVFVYCFTSFGIVMSIGGIKYTNFEVAIQSVLSSGIDFSQALGYGIIQFGIITGLNIYISFKFKSENEKIESNMKNEKCGTVVKTVAVSYMIFEYTIIIIGILSSFYNFYTLKFDIKGIVNIFSTEFNQEYKVLEAFLNSFIISIISAIAVTILTYIILKRRDRLTDTMVLSAMGISSAFIALAFYYMNILYNIPLFLLISAGYIFISLPVSYSYLHHHIAGFDKEIIEAAKTDGAGKRAVFFKIELPILIPVFISNILQITALIFGEFTIAYTMQAGDYIPLVSTVNYSLFSSRHYLEGSAMSAVSVIMILGLFYISKRLTIKERR